MNPFNRHPDMKPTAASPLNRRQFLQRAAAGLALPLLVPGSVLGRNGVVAPSNRIVFGGIGMGHRARHILPNFCRSKIHCAVSDAARTLAEAKEMVDAHYPLDCAMHEDFRLSARPDIDAVLIAWQSLARHGVDVRRAPAGHLLQTDQPDDSGGPTW